VPKVGGGQDGGGAGECDARNRMRVGYPQQRSAMTGRITSMVGLFTLGKRMLTTRTGKLRRITVTCIVVLAAACTQNPQATVLSPSTSAPTVIPTALPTVEATHTPKSVATPDEDAGPPLRPAEAEGLTIPAAEAFVHYFFDLLNYLKSTGDGSAVRNSAEAGCRACKVVLKNYTATNAHNGGITGDFRWRDVKVSGAKLVDAETAEVKVSARQGRYSVPHAPNRRKQVPTQQYYLSVTLSARGNQWVMFEMTTEDAE